jgi:hypothetical protein
MSSRSAESAAEAWVADVNSLAEQAFRPTRNSPDPGANLPGKPRVFMPHIGFPSFVEKCEQVAAKLCGGFDSTGELIRFRVRAMISGRVSERTIRNLPADDISLDEGIFDGKGGAKWGE